MTPVKIQQEFHWAGKVFPSVRGHDLDAAGGVARLVFGDVRDLGHVLRRQLAAVGGHHHTDAVVAHEGHTVPVALGGHQILDLGLRQGVRRQHLDALRRLVEHGGVRPVLRRRLFQQVDGVVPGLLPGQPSRGKVVRPSVYRLLIRRGGGVSLPGYQRGLAQNFSVYRLFPGVSGVFPVQKYRRSDQKQHGNQHGVLPQFPAHSALPPPDYD